MNKNMEVNTMKRVYEFLKKAGVFFVATEEGSEPKVRPFGFTMIYNNRLYFCTNSQKPVYRQLQKNPHVEICACIGTEWVRIKGSAVFDQDLEAKKNVFITDPSMNGLYKAEDEIFRIFYISNASATFCSMDGTSDTIDL